MRWPNLRRPVMLIVGPTAVGKTQVSIELAERLDAEIVSSDSRLFYRGMDIGTAKPSQAEQQRVTHHLIDVANPDENWSLAIFQKAAREMIADIHSRGKLPLVVGGTGQYTRALLEDWDIPIQPPDTELRAVLEAWGREVGAIDLHRKLASVDPQAAARIEPQNLRRTIRALEVMLLTGRRFSEQYHRRGSPYTRLVIGLRRQRADLFARIDQRIDAMFADGWVQEVRTLINDGYSTQLPAFSAIGYREIAEALEGKQTMEETIVQIKRKSRQFVRRQANWFRELDPSIYWYDASNSPVERIITLAESQECWLLPDREELTGEH